MKKIRQAVVPAAGLGTRFLPITKCFPKELVPLVDKPCLQHVVDDAVAAGVEEFIFVISREKELIRDYFARNDRLNEALERQGRHDVLSELSRIETQATYRFVYQDAPLGLGHAVSCAREAVTDDTFFVLLPDDVIVAEESVCTQMANARSEGVAGMVAVMPVKWEDVSRYGIVRAAPLTDVVGDVEDIVEKPRREDAPSNLAVMGRYLLPRSIFTVLERVKPGSGGEIQLTDALRLLIGDGGLRSFSFQGERYDTGTPMDWLLANFSLALKDPRYADAVARVAKTAASIR